MFPCMAPPLAQAAHCGQMFLRRVSPWKCLGAPPSSIMWWPSCSSRKMRFVGPLAAFSLVWRFTSHLHLPTPSWPVCKTTPAFRKGERVVVLVRAVPQLHSFRGWCSRSRHRGGILISWDGPWRPDRAASRTSKIRLCCFLFLCKVPGRRNQRLP